MRLASKFGGNVLLGVLVLGVMALLASPSVARGNPYEEDNVTVVKTSQSSVSPSAQPTGAEKGKGAKKSGNLFDSGPRFPDTGEDMAREIKDLASAKKEMERAKAEYEAIVAPYNKKSWIGKIFTSGDDYDRVVYSRLRYSLAGMLYLSYSRKEEKKKKKNY